MRKLYSLIVLFTIVLLSSCAKDEVNPFGNIYGVVVNSNTSEPIQGARVTLTPTGKSTVTGNDGSYEFVDLEAGSYKVTVQANGYTSTLKNVTVVAGEKAIGDVSISPKPQNSKLGVSNDLVLFTKSIKNTTINIQNLGNAGDINWTITNVPSWLTVSPVQGSTGVGKETAVALSLNSSFAGKGDCVLIISAVGESVSVLVNADTNSDEGTGGDGEGENSDDYSSAKTETCDSEIEIGIVSCKRLNSNVVFKFYVKNIREKDFSDVRLYTIGGAWGGNVLDDLSNPYDYNSTYLKFAGKNPSSGCVNTALVSGLETQGELTIKNVPAAVKSMALIEIAISKYSDGGSSFLERSIKFKNVPIY